MCYIMYYLSIPNWRLRPSHWVRQNGLVGLLPRLMICADGCLQVAELAVAEAIPHKLADHWSL